MKVELLNHKQQRVGSWESADSEHIQRLLSELSPQEDFTVLIYHAGCSLVIAVDRGLYTLFVQLGNEEFYDYVSTTSKQGGLEFMEGGQKVQIDRQHLASASAVRETISAFASNPAWARESSQWQRQI